MIGNILDNTTELYIIKYTFGKNFSSGGATLYKNPSDQTVAIGNWRRKTPFANIVFIFIARTQNSIRKSC